MPHSCKVLPTEARTCEPTRVLAESNRLPGTCATVPAVKISAARFSDDPANGQDHTCQDPRHSTRQNDLENRPQFSGAQSEASFPVGIRHRNQCLFRCSHDQRQDHDRQRHRIRPAWNNSSQGVITNRIYPNKPYTMDGMPCKSFRRHPDNFHQFAARFWRIPPDRSPKISLPAPPSARDSAVIYTVLMIAGIMDMLLCVVFPGKQLRLKMVPRRLPVYI